MAIKLKKNRKKEKKSEKKRKKKIEFIRKGAAVHKKSACFHINKLYFVIKGTYKYR